MEFKPWHRYYYMSVIRVNVSSEWANNNLNRYLNDATLIALDHSYFNATEVEYIGPLSELEMIIYDFTEDMF